MPELSNAMQQANVVGCGLRVDTSGNALVSARIGTYVEATKQLVADQAVNSDLPPSLYESGGFVLGGAGHLPIPILAAYIKGYARGLIADLKTEERTVLDETTVKRMLEAADRAAAEIRTAYLLSQPGEDQQPVYSNSFIAVRVESAKTFVGHAQEVMRLWNSANRDAKGETKLVFDVEDTKLGERTATQYSLDMAALAGGLVLPEIRQSMEKLFGPGGKLRLWIVPIDDNTVLLAEATPDQMTAVLNVYDKKRKIDWNRGELSETNALLPAESDWRVFIDPHRYFDWQRREMATVAGVPIIGGALVRDFPASPPIGIAGGFREGELWLEAAALAPTVKNADAYFNRNRSRFSIQLRARDCPRPRARPGAESEIVSK